MRTLQVMRALGPVDARSIMRDSMMRWIVILVLPLGLLYRYGVPAVTRWCRQRFDVDIVPYHPLIMSSVALIVAGFLGTVTGFLLLDQRDERTLPALLVTPLGLGDYLRYRLLVPTAIGVLLTATMFVVAGVTAPLQVAITSLAAAPLSAMYTLFIGSFAANKVQGFALAKGIGVLFIPATAAFFAPMPWQILLGAAPFYWPMKVFWLFEEARPGTAVAFAAAGLAYHACLLWLLGRRLARVLRR